MSLFVNTSDWQRYEGTIAGLTRRFPRDIREEVAQEARIYVWQKIRDGGPVYNIAIYHKMIDAVREQKLHPKYSRSDYIPDFVGLDDVDEIAADEGDGDDRLLVLLDGLPKADAALLEASYVDEISHKNIGARIGKSAAWVRDRIQIVINSLSTAGIVNGSGKKHTLPCNKLRAARAGAC